MTVFSARFLDRAKVFYSQTNTSVVKSAPRRNRFALMFLSDTGPFRKYGFKMCIDECYPECLEMGNVDKNHHLLCDLILHV